MSVLSYVRQQRKIILGSVGLPKNDGQDYIPIDWHEDIVKTRDDRAAFYGKKERKDTDVGTWLPKLTELRNARESSST